MKNSGMRIRVDVALRDAFVLACKGQQTTAAQVLRTFMQSYVEHVAYGRQRELALELTNDRLTIEQM